LKERDMGMNGRMILKWKWIVIGCEGVTWIHLAQDRDQW
jgi:hypothetical protein